MAGFMSWECQSGKCQQPEHADFIMSCITKYDLNRLRTVFKITCNNAAKISDGFGRCALHIAVSSGKYDVAEWLIKEHSAEIHMKDFESGWNALHRSLFYGNIDCAILLIKSGLDFNIQDKEGVTPLKLVFFDSHRSNMLKSEKEKIKLGRVILPYHASAQGELSLEIDQLVDVLKEYKSTGWGLGRVCGKKERGKFPLNFIEILGNKQNDFSADQLTEKGNQSDAYLWGSNSNFTLGQSNTKNRETPELVEKLHFKKCSIIQIAVSKYHTVFLCKNGSVYSCGQGRGGRLGHGNEQTVLSPKRISGLDGIFCTAIANANDHTLILDQMGQVFSFGLNTYHQLGHYPVRVHCLAPTLITHKQLRGKFMTGIAAARFHSAIHTRNELFTFGLNGGQLGHIKGDSWQSIPRLVSSICKNDCTIECVAVSDGATCCCLSNGDIFVLQDYSFKRITTKMMNIKKFVVAGGELKCQVLTDLHHQDPDELRIALLKTDGTVFAWRQGYGSFKECFWAGKRRDVGHVADISLGKHLLIATDEGTAFYGYFRSSRTAPSNQSKTTPNRSDMKTSSRTMLDQLFSRIKARREDCEEVTIERVPLLYRAYSVACDVKSKTFAVIQNDPWIGMKSFVKITKRTLNNDLGEMLNEADVMDNIHDVIIKVKGGELPAHRFILVSKIGNAISRLLQFDETLNKYVLSLKHHDMNTVQNWLTDIYTGKAQEMIGSSSCKSWHKVEEFYDLADSDYELDALVMHSFSLRDIDSPDYRGARSFCDENGDVRENLPTARKIKRKREKEAVLSDRRSDLNTVEGKGMKFWKQMETLSDIKIEAEDGSLFHCHKCILVARLEYFKSMLTSPWMESNYIDKSVKIPMPSRVLKNILDFAYTDEAPELRDCLNVDLLYDVILFADQWLIVRLKEICESSLVKQLSLKNALEMLNFACTYNAENLKKISCEFVCINLGYYLETRSLEFLSTDVLSQLSKAYKRLIPNMAYRIITPEMDFSNEEEFDSQYKQLMNMEHVFDEEANIFHDDIKQEKSVRDKNDISSRKKRRRRKSSSVRENSFCEEANVVTNEQEPQRQGGRVKCNSLPDESDTAKNEEVNTDYTSEEKNSLSQATSFTSPPIDSKSPSAFGVKSLREIMKEEESLGKVFEVKNGVVCKPKSKTENSSADGASSNVSIKWDSSKKKSQKQRKEELKSNGIHVQRTSEQKVLSEKENSDVKASFPWGRSDITPVKSLKDVMNEEISATTPKSMTPSHQNKLSNGTRRKLSWKGVSKKTEPAVSTPNDRAWNMERLAESPPSAVVSLSAIIESQSEEKSASIQLLKKPLQLIQIEEKAMEELLLHYNAKDNPSEYITVRRAKDVTESPVWNVDTKS